MRLAIDIHAIGSQQTGNETYIRNLVEHLSAAEAPDVEILLYHTRPMADHRWDARLRRVRPHNPAFRIPISFPLAFYRDQVDVAHFQYQMPPVSPCPCVVSIHDISYEDYPEFFHPLERLRMKALIPLSARQAAHIVTLSEFSKRQIHERYRIPAEKITVTYPGVPKGFGPLPKESAEERTRRFDLRRPYVLAVGNLQPRKNIARLIRVFARLRRQGRIDLDLVLAGKSAWKGRTILEEIVRQKAEPFVTVTGYVTDNELVALYNRAEIFVYPSFTEGFGLPLLEAMACGVPIITSRTSCMPEVCADAALFLDPASDESLAAALERLAADGDQRRALVERGKRRAGRFSWEETARATLDVYRRATK